MPRNTPEFQARIVATERLRSSVNGNPRFRIAFDNGEMRTTQSDASIGYDVENCAPRHGSAPLLDVYTTRAGNVSYWTRVTDE